MFRSAVRRRRGDPGWAEEERRAFARLRDLIVSEAETAPVTPRCAVHEDQIVWGRSPARLDLAGGWTDTPPYCLEHGGRVVNFAANLNGQPPVQVFARPTPSPELVLRSIDLGSEQRVRSFEEQETFARPGDEFAPAKAALALAGFLPRFRAGAPFPSLRAVRGPEPFEHRAPGHAQLRPAPRTGRRPTGPRGKPSGRRTRGRAAGPGPAGARRRRVRPVRPLELTPGSPTGRSARSVPRPRRFPPRSGPRPRSPQRAGDRSRCTRSSAAVRPRNRPALRSG